jgi:autotransporter-associated beta strand protein
MCVRSGSVLICAAAAWAACWAPVARAQTWDGESNSRDDWSGAANWNPNGAPLNDGSANIIMAGSVRPTPNVDLSWDIQSLSFENTLVPFVIGGNTLTIRGGGVTNNDAFVETVDNVIHVDTTETWTAAGGPLVFNGTVRSNFNDTLTIDGASDTTFAGSIANKDSSDVLALTKTGTGTLVFSGAAANAYTGLTTVSAGTLRLNKSVADGAIPTNVSIESGSGTSILVLDASEQIGNGNVNLFGSGAKFELNGFSETIGTVTISGGGSITGGAGGMLNLNGGLASGITTFAASDSARISTNLNLGATQRVFNIANGLASDDAIVDGAISNGSLLKNNAGQLVLAGDGANTYGATSVTAGTLVLRKAASGTVAAAGDVSIGDGSGVDTVRLGQSEQIGDSATVTLASSGVLDLSTFNETIGALTNNGGQVTVSAGGKLTVTNTLTVNGAAQLPSSRISAGNLSISSGGVATLTPGGDAPMTVGGLALAGTTDAWSARLDVNDNDVVVHSDDASRVAKAAEITNQLKQGANFANTGQFWTGNGIVTSLGGNGSTSYAAVGVAVNDFALLGGGQTGAIYSTFDGQDVGVNDVLVKYTYFGDADLDGAVTTNDYFQIDNGFLGSKTGWINGDFDYDGAVTTNDYFLIDNAFLGQGAALVPAALGSAGALSGVTAVPEPASLGVFAFAAAVLIRRRRCHLA